MPCEILIDAFCGGVNAKFDIGSERCGWRAPGWALVSFWKRDGENAEVGLENASWGE